MQVGDVNLLNSAIDAEFRIGVMEKLLETVVNKMSSYDRPTQQQLNDIKKQVANELKSKYPNMGLQFNV